MQARRQWECGNDYYKRTLQNQYLHVTSIDFLGNSHVNPFAYRHVYVRNICVLQTNVTNIISRMNFFKWI